MKSIKIDKKDLKILYELDINARQSSSNIAKKVGLSKDAVNYRINRLIKEKVIKKFYLVLNTLKLGFLHFNTLFRFRNITPEVKQKFIAYCQKHKNVIWCVTCYGSWDFGVSFLTKDLEEYDVFLNDLLDKFGNKIHEKSLFLLIDSPTYTKEYLINSSKGKEFNYKAAEKTEIDKTEQTILSALSQNARINIVELAEILKLSPEIIRYRIEKLTEKGIIQGFRASIDTEKIGYSYYKILFSVNDFTLNTEKAFRTFCLNNSNIVSYIRYLGQYEVQIEIEIEPDKIYSLLEKIRNNFPDIIKTYEVLRLKEEKLDYYPFNKSIQ